MEQVDVGARRAACSRSRGRATLRAVAAAPVVLTLEVTDPEVLAELRRHAEGDERDALRPRRAARRRPGAARGERARSTPARSARPARRSSAEVRELLSARATEMTERVVVDAHAVPRPAERRRCRSASKRSSGRTASSIGCSARTSGADDSVLARSLAVAPRRGQPHLQAALADRRERPARAAREDRRGGARRAAQAHPARVLARPERLGALAPRRRVLARRRRLGDEPPVEDARGDERADRQEPDARRRGLGARRA